MDLKKLFAERDTTKLAEFAKANDLVIQDGKLVPRNEEAKQKLKEKVGFWDQRQQARKIL